MNINEEIVEKIREMNIDDDTKAALLTLIEMGVEMTVEKSSFMQLFREEFHNRCGSFGFRGLSKAGNSTKEKMSDKVERDFSLLPVKNPTYPNGNKIKIKGKWVNLPTFELDKDDKWGKD